MSNRVYLDLCCFKRPFDDQRDARVREEAAAVAALISRAESGRYALVRSPAHLVENDANPREDRRVAAALWLERAAVTVEQTPEIEARAVALSAAGYPPLDALHVAFAEAAGARWFVTCDDRLLKLAARRVGDVKTPVVAPGAVLAEEIGEER
jgi:predicted nucleic acid-binding protein